MTTSLLSSQQAAYNYIHKTLSVFMNSSQTVLPHFIMSGSTGTGKSMLVRQLAKQFDIPVLDLNGAQLTPEGYQGASLSKLLVPLAGKKDTPVIVLIDEFDKLFNPTAGSHTLDKSAVQQELLHIISSKQTKVIADYGHYSTINMSKVLFIFAGAFNNKEHITPNFLASMGMEPELLGRVNLHIHVPNVDITDLLTVAREDELFLEYADALDLTSSEISKAKDSVVQRITETWQTSCIGYRIVQRTIHQYFLLDGIYPVEEEVPVEEPTPEITLTDDFDFDGD